MEVTLKDLWILSQDKKVFRSGFECLKLMEHDGHVELRGYFSMPVQSISTGIVLGTYVTMSAAYAEMEHIYDRIDAGDTMYKVRDDADAKPKEKTSSVIDLIEKALGIELRDWQKEYVLGRSNWVMPGRQTGKTLAYMLKLCVTPGCMMKMYPDEFHYACIPDYPGQVPPMRYRQFFAKELEQIYRKLETVWIPLRKIYFSKEEYNDGCGLWDANRRSGI